MWLSKKDKREEINSAAIVSVLIIFLLFMLWNFLIESWKWINFIIFLLIGSILYHGLNIIEKKRKETPASLWKEFKYKYPIVIQYTPPKDLNPAEAWLLYNCKVDITDLTCLIYQRALEWLIDIKYIKSENSWNNTSKVELTKLRDIESSRPFFEVEIFNSIFCVKSKKIIENSSQLRYALLLEDLEFHWIKKWWLYRKTWWKTLKFVYWVLFILMYTSLYWLLNWWYLMIISLITFIISLFWCIFIWWYIDWGTWLKLTDKWAKLAAYVIWYRNFIKGCDENMIKLQLKNDPLFIDKTLPYATAFGLETEFINKVSPLVHDFKAQYIHWKKVTVWMKIIAFLLKSANKSHYNMFYRW